MDPVTTFINKYPSEVKKIMQKVRTEIQKSAPEAIEQMRYGVPAFKQGEKSIVYSAFKTHLGIYPSPETIKHFKKELSKYEKSGSTIKFHLNEPIPYELIKKIVEYNFNNT